MILATRHGNACVRSVGGMFTGIDAIPLPSVGVGLGVWSAAGRRVTPEMAVGLPAMLRAVRVYAETIAAMPLLTIEKTSEGNRERAEGCWQWELLYEKPNDTQKSPFNFKEFIVASIMARGNAYILKSKARGRLRGLYPISPKRVVPRYLKDGETLVYDVRSASGNVTTVDSSVMLHIPGALMDDPCIGVSPILLTANAIGSALAAEEFSGRYYDNDATPGGVIEFKQSGDSQAARDTRATWEDRHRSARNAHRVAALFGGATYKQVGVDAQAAQIVETQRWSVEQVARAMGLPAWILGGIDQNPRSTPEQRNSELLTFSIAPPLKRIEECLWGDDDLFPDKDLFPFFESNHLVRAEMFARYQSYSLARQGGWQSINDIRRKENEPPVEGGDIYQETPVGGAPNLQPGQQEPQSADDEVPADPEEVE